MWMRFYCKHLARCLTVQFSVRKNWEAKFLNAEELGQPGPGPQWRHGAARRDELEVLVLACSFVFSSFLCGSYCAWLIQYVYNIYIYTILMSTRLSGIWTGI